MKARFDDYNTDDYEDDSRSRKKLNKIDRSFKRKMMEVYQ